MNVGLFLDRLSTAILIGTFAWMLVAAIRGKKIKTNQLWPPFLIADSIGLVGNLMEHHYGQAAFTAFIMAVIVAMLVWSARRSNENEDEADEI